MKLKLAVLLFVGAGMLGAQAGVQAKGPLTAVVVVLRSEQVASFIPVPPNLTFVNIFITTTTATTARFRISIKVKDGTSVIQMSQEVDRNPIMATPAQFRVPFGATLDSPVSIVEISSPLDFV